LRKGSKSSKNLLPFHRINHQIRAREVRVLDETGAQIDIMELSKAIELAQAEDKDVVEIASTAQPPVVKVIDYKKFLYQMKKKKADEKRGAKVSDTKEIRMGPFIGEHDLEIKLKRAREFFADGHKVRMTVRFTGREMARRDLGVVLMNRIIEKLSEVAKIEKEGHFEGRQYVALLSKVK